MSIDKSQENETRSQSPLRSSVETSTMRDFVFLKDSNANTRTSNPRMKLRSTAGDELSISHNVPTPAISNSITVAKYVCRAEEGATDLVCSKKDVIPAAPVSTNAKAPATRDTGCRR